MKKSISITAILFLVIWTSSFSQTYVIQVKPENTEFWGYAGLDGKLIIQAKYQKSSEFSKEGLAAIYDKSSKKFSIINLNGETIPVEISDFQLKTIFFVDVPNGYEDGMIIVGQGKKWGFLNPQGKVAIPIKYDKVSEFHDGFASAEIDGKWLVIDKKGIEYPINDSKVAAVNHFTENLAPFTREDKIMGFINSNGQIAIPAKFTALGFFSDSLAWARDANNKIGYINHGGDWVIKPQFDVARNYSSEAGLARVKLNGAWGYVNKKGEIMYVKVSTTFDDFFDGLAQGETKDKKRGYYNNKGEWAIQPQFEDERDFKNKYAAVKKDGKWGIIDTEGKWIIQPVFDGIRDVVLIEK